MESTESEAAEQPRPTVVFFPWAAIESEFSPEGIELRHYDPDDSIWPQDVRGILDAYDRCAGQRVESATILAYAGEVGGRLADAQIETAFSFREALSFAAMRERKFFENSNYCNDHTFACIAQAYVPGRPGATAISRRRDGRSMTFLGDEFHRVICPHYVAAESRIVLNDPLLPAIFQAMGDPKCDWVRDGIELFNLANTDSPQIPSHTELMLIVGATQRLLGVQNKSDADKLAQHFAETLYGAAPQQLGVEDSPRTRNGKSRSLAQAWFFDLYSDRGSVAHGRPRPIGNRLWRREEHLLLAAYIVPRIALVRLASTGHYVLTERDVDELSAFEYLLCLNDVFGSAEEGSLTGLPERVYPRTGRYAWSAALWTAESEQQHRRFFREHDIHDV